LEFVDDSENGGLCVGRVDDAVEVDLGQQIKQLNSVLYQQFITASHVLEKTEIEHIELINNVISNLNLFDVGLYQNVKGNRIQMIENLNKVAHEKFTHLDVLMVFYQCEC
jgi:hypothetical protein